MYKTKKKDSKSRDRVSSGTSGENAQSTFNVQKDKIEPPEEKGGERDSCCRRRSADGKKPKRPSLGEELRQEGRERICFDSKKKLKRVAPKKIKKKLSRHALPKERPARPDKGLPGPKKKRKKERRKMTQGESAAEGQETGIEMGTGKKAKKG